MSERSEPYTLFSAWYAEAAQTDSRGATVMTLATLTADHKPSARIVLLSSFDDRGFVFHSNYHSDKGQQLAQNSAASLVFWWPSLGYQVRIEGQVEKTTSDESDAYFAARPRGSQLGAWASAQSQPLTSRTQLEDQMAHLTQRYAGQRVPRPPHWGGYRLQPQRFEFWISRDDRLHDRTVYQRQLDGRWSIGYLYP